jgi:hypothetical protein
VRVAVAFAVTDEAADNIDVWPNEFAFRLGSVTRKKSSGIGSFPDNNLCSHLLQVIIKHQQILV